MVIPDDLDGSPMCMSTGWFVIISLRNLISLICISTVILQHDSTLILLYIWSILTRFQYVHIWSCFFVLHAFLSDHIYMDWYCFDSNIHSQLAYVMSESFYLLPDIYFHMLMLGLGQKGGYFILSKLLTSMWIASRAEKQHRPWVEPSELVMLLKKWHCWKRLDMGSCIYGGVVSSWWLDASFSAAWLLVLLNPHAINDWLNLLKKITTFKGSSSPMKSPTM